MTERTIVAVGCSRDRDYSFALPLTCALWEHVVGFIPIALLVGAQEEWEQDPRAAVVLKHLGGIAHEFIGRAKGFPDHTTAQNCRQHAAALSLIQPSTWIMPGDADLWPLERTFYEQHEGTEHLAVCYYSNGDHFVSKENVLERAKKGLGAQTIPTCHVAMRAQQWRDVYGLVEDDVAGSIEKTMAVWVPRRAATPDPNMVLWMSDQQIMTEKLCAQDWFPERVLMVQRHGHPPVDRLDRAQPTWAHLDPNDYVDAHIYRGPESEKWNELIRVFATVLPEMETWAREYREAYVGVTL